MVYSHIFSADSWLVKDLPDWAKIDPFIMVSLDSNIIHCWFRLNTLWEQETKANKILWKHI